MDETTLTVTLSALLIVAIIGGMIIGRRNRTKRQRYIAHPLEVPQYILDQQPSAMANGIYVTTILGNHLLERVTAHRLGNRSQGQLEVHPTGVAILRAGEPNIFIPTSDIITSATVSGMAGKFVEKDGLLAITWWLDETEVTTGFRAETIEEHQALRTQLDTLTNGRQTA